MMTSDQIFKTKLIERLEQETKIYEYILGSINKELNYERHDRTI